MNGYEDIDKCTSMQRLVACNNHISDTPPHRWNKGTSTIGSADMLNEQRGRYKATSLENLTSSPLNTRLRRKTFYIYSPYNSPPIDATAM